MRWYDLRHPDTAAMIAGLLAALAVLHLLIGQGWVAFGMLIGFTAISLWLWRGRARVKTRSHHRGPSDRQQPTACQSESFDFIANQQNVVRCSQITIKKG